MPRGAIYTLRAFSDGALYATAGLAPTDLNSAACAAPDSMAADSISRRRARFMRRPF